jgi:hypothetical protein
MKSFEEFENDEITVTRKEFAEASARVVNGIVDGMRLKGEMDFKTRAMFTAMLAVLMDDLFGDMEDEGLEIE